MNAMELRVINTKHKLIGENRNNITFFPQNNEWMEWLLKQMLQDAYEAGRTNAKAEEEKITLKQKGFKDFYVRFVDRDVQSSMNKRVAKKDDYYNTLLDLIYSREQLRWKSGFHEGRVCSLYEEREIVG